MGNNQSLPLVEPHFDDEWEMVQYDADDEEWELWVEDRFPDDCVHEYADNDWYDSLMCKKVY